MPLKPKFQHPLRSIRQTIGLTQPAFGKKVGCSGSAIQQIENGQKKLSSSLASRIAVFTGANFVELQKGRTGRALNVHGAPFTKEFFDEWREPQDRVNTGVEASERAVNNLVNWLRILFMASARRGTSKLPVLRLSFVEWLERARLEFKLEAQIDAILDELKRLNPERYIDSICYIPPAERPASLADRALQRKRILKLGWTLGLPGPDLTPLLSASKPSRTCQA
jgi:transcriptional regulator with XRE-family HTH domain